MKEHKNQDSNQRPSKNEKTENQDRAMKGKKHHPVKFCPKCGSTDVYWAQGMPQFWSLWQCRNCGYRGPVILEDGKMAQILQEKWIEHNHPEDPY